MPPLPDTLQGHPRRSLRCTSAGRRKVGQFPGRFWRDVHFHAATVRLRRPTGKYSGSPTQAVARHEPAGDLGAASRSLTPTVVNRTVGTGTQQTERAGVRANQTRSEVPRHARTSGIAKHVCLIRRRPPSLSRPLTLTPRQSALRDCSPTSCAFASLPSPIAFSKRLFTKRGKRWPENSRQSSRR
jgi:hypothetical protein